MVICRCVYSWHLGLRVYERPHLCIAWILPLPTVIGCPWLSIWEWDLLREIPCHIGNSAGVVIMQILFRYHFVEISWMGSSLSHNPLQRGVTLSCGSYHLPPPPLCFPWALGIRLYCRWSVRVRYPVSLGLCHQPLVDPWSPLYWLQESVCGEGWKPHPPGRDGARALISIAF